MDAFFSALPEYIELFLEYAGIFITIAIPVAIWIAYRKTQNETGQAKKTADRLGLRHVNVAEEMKQTKPKDSLLLSLFSSWSPWAMEGVYNGVSVRVEQIVKSKQTRDNHASDRMNISNASKTTYSKYTAYVAYFDRPLSFDISIRPNIPVPSLVGMLRAGLPQSGTGDMPGTGDAELDQILQVWEGDRDRFREWLNSAGNKNALKKVYQALPEASIDSDRIRYNDNYTKADYGRIQKNLELLRKSVKNLRRD